MTFTAMFQRWLTSASASGPIRFRHDSSVLSSPLRTSTDAVSVSAARRPQRQIVLSSYVVALIFLLALGTPPSVCSAKQPHNSGKSGLDSSWEADSSSLLFHHQRRGQNPGHHATTGVQGGSKASDVQDTKWPPMPKNEEDVVREERHPKRRHRRPQQPPAVVNNRTTLYEKLAAATAARDNRGRHRGSSQPLPKRTMPYYLAILNGEELAPTTSTRWREVNDSSSSAPPNGGVVRSPRVKPLRPPSASSEDYLFGGGGGGDADDEDDNGDLDEEDDDDDEMDPAVADAVRGSASRTHPRDAVLKSSKDALIVTKKSYLKKDWCKTEPLVQRVREPGCMTRTIVNRFCYGQCNSFYIPKNTKQDLESGAFKSCSFCKPKRFTWITITLRCPGQHPPYKRKRIQRIKKCKCISEILQ